MNDCDRIIQKLNAYLDGALDVDLGTLRRQAQHDDNCLSVFEAMLNMHALFNAAPMALSERHFAASVTAELARRERRQKWALIAVIALGALTVLLPLLPLVWAGIAFLLQPELLSQIITTTLTFLSDATAIVIALLTAANQLPLIARIGLSTAFALGFLLVALAAANRTHPELIQTSREFTY